MAKRRLKILFDLRPVRRPMSGVATYCANLIRTLASACAQYQFAALYCGSQHTNPVLAEARDLRFPSASVVPHKLLMLGLEFAPGLGRIMVKGRYDLVHETYFANAYPTGRVPKIATIHDVIPVERPEYVNRRNRFFSRRNLRRQCREAARIIAVSNYTKQKIIEFTGVPAERITVIPCGVTPMHAEREQHYLETRGLAGRRYLLFIGNIEARKNIGLVARALRDLGSCYDDVQFVVAGHKNYLSDPILAECAASLADRFHYVGFVSEAQKWTLMSSAAAFVLPSLYEGFGIPVIESYQANCPTLIANNSSLTELSIDERQLFDGNSSSSLAARLRDTLDGSAWVAQTVVRAARGLHRYEWNSVAALTAAVYAQVLG